MNWLEKVGVKPLPRGEEGANLVAWWSTRAGCGSCRVLGLVGIGCGILRLFLVDLDQTFWRIVALGVTGAPLVGIGYVYSRFYRHLAGADLDWKPS